MTLRLERVRERREILWRFFGARCICHFFRDYRTQNDDPRLCDSDQAVGLCVQDVFDVIEERPIRILVRDIIRGDNVSTDTAARCPPIPLS